MVRVVLVGVLALGLVGSGTLLYFAQQASAPSNEAERACVAALQQELKLGSGADLHTASWRADGEHVTAEWRYGSMRAGSGVMPVGRGEMRCALRDGRVDSIDIEKYYGTP